MPPVSHHQQQPHPQMEGDGSKTLNLHQVFYCTTTNISSTTTTTFTTTLTNTFTPSPPSPPAQPPPSLPPPPPRPPPPRAPRPPPKQSPPSSPSPPPARSSPPQPIARETIDEGEAVTLDLDEGEKPNAAAGNEQRREQQQQPSPPPPPSPPPSPPSQPILLSPGHLEIVHASVWDIGSKISGFKVQLYSKYFPYLPLMVPIFFRSF